jgi:putative heme-binding domain-containing protein
MSVTQKVGPDGALYITDWQDKTTCHRRLPELWDQTNGRLYRISYVNVGVQALAAPPLPKAPFDLTQEKSGSLLRLALQTENEWFSRMARRVLVERTISNPDLVTKARVEIPDDEAGKLRAIWLAQSVSNLAKDPAAAAHAYQPAPAPNEATPTLRVHLIRQSDPLKEKAKLKALAEKDASAPVRRELASALQRLPINQRRDLATALLQRSEDKDDPVIPLLIWYGIEPLVGADPKAGLALASRSKMPKVSAFIYRRLTETAAGWDAVFSEAEKTGDAALKLSLVTVLVDARKRGVPQAERGENWPGSAALLTPDSDSPPALKQLILELSILEREPAAVTHARTLLADPKAPRPQRELALDLLLKNQDPETAPILHQILQGRTAAPPTLRRAAIQALASLPHPDNAKVLLGAFASLAPAQQSEVVNALATSAENARALVAAVGSKNVPRQLLSPFLLRQMQSLKNAELDQLMKDTLGDLNAPKANLAEQTAKYRAILTPEALAGADTAAGKLVYGATCGACHKLFGEGQNVGPDITGSNRTDMNYLLENVLDPNGVIGKEYQLNLFTLKDGRVMGGIVKEESEAAVKIAMMGGAEFLLAKADITSREVSKQSTMPEGLFDALPKDMLLNLVKYLQSGGSAPGSTRAGVIEGESLKATTTGGTIKTQAMGGFRDGTWSGASQLWWAGAKPGDKLTTTFDVPNAGRQKVFAVFTKARDYGIITVRLNGVETDIQDYDLYDPKVMDTGEELLGEFDLKAGPNTLEIEITGTNPAATPRHMAALDYLRLQPQ